MVSSTNYNITIGTGSGASIGATAPVKFGPKKEREEKPIIVQDAKIKFHKIKLSDKKTVQGSWPEDYIIKTEEELSSIDIEKKLELMNRYRLITFKNPSKKVTLSLKGCYQIDNIVAPQRYQGAGTKALQSLLERSLADKDCEGRLVVNAEITDGQVSPAGFFYKLGFRFLDNSMNDVMEQWVKRNIKTDFPNLTGVMYLPKTNVNKLMMYGRNLL